MIEKLNNIANEVAKEEAKRRKKENVENIEFKRMEYITDKNERTNEYINYFELIGKVNQKSFKIQLFEEEINKLGLFSGNDKLLYDRFKKIIYPKIKEINEKLQLQKNGIKYSGQEFKYGEEIQGPFADSIYNFNNVSETIREIYDRLENKDTLDEESEYLYSVKKDLEKLLPNTPVLHCIDVDEYYPAGMKEFKNRIEMEIIPLLNGKFSIEQSNN